ncbi:hypothetical protein [Mycobacterium riyadhense]|uniref:hypothetical protein n=1 Tax=Mycobacterium riyadhense TaxID=486698 RepID=UPI0033906957
MGVAVSAGMAGLAAPAGTVARSWAWALMGRPVVTVAMAASAGSVVPAGRVVT